jgi:hypothetical protein
VFCFEFAEGVCAGKITAEARRRRARCFVLSSRRVCCGENNRGGAKTRSPVFCFEFAEVFGFKFTAEAQTCLSADRDAEGCFVF